MSKAPIVIIGASLTGATAAAALRSQGYDGELVLVGEEDRRPYERPPLTKDLLRGESEPEAAAVHEPAFYAENDIELRLGRRATELRTGDREVVLDDGERLRYDRALIATGARPRTLDVPGADLDGVVTLRTVDDALALRERISSGGRLAVIGGGWIGMEAAASARQSGAEVSIVESLDIPLGRVLGPEMGELFTWVHRSQGVDVLTGARLLGFEGDGRVTGVRLETGPVLECDTVLVGVGVAPNAELAEAAGLKVSNGIETDALLRTSDEHVFAAGDVAFAEHPRYGRVRVEHWENARRQGEAVAASMLGRGRPFDAIPYFFSDQYDVGMEYSGLSDPADELLVRGDKDARELIAFWLREGAVVAGMNVNIWDVQDDIRALIEGGLPIDRERLADPDTPIADAVAATA
jgi:3-phenylpropionate/trans-cinnamate dioxygenase ferredoxin reductase subunit